MTILIRIIGFATSIDSTTNIIENIGATIDQMDPELPNICSLVSNGLVHFCCQDTVMSTGITHKLRTNQ